MTKNSRSAAPPIRRHEGSVFYIEPIALYNQQQEKVGETYPRRAKQLVLKGRAVWLKENAALQLTMNACSPTVIKEESTMKDMNMPFDLQKGDELLMYFAKKNVQEKRSLIKHIAAFALASLVLYILFENFAIGSHPMSHLALRSIDELTAIANISDPTTRSNSHIGLSDDSFRSVYRIVVSTISYIHPIWYFIVGIMTAWGGWVFVRFSAYIAVRIRTRNPKRHDPVAAEYMRLKSMTSIK